MIIESDIFFHWKELGAPLAPEDQAEQAELGAGAFVNKKMYGIYTYIYHNLSQM